MTGTRVLRAPDGCPYGGDHVAPFKRPEIVAFGKVRRYCDFVTRFMVRLADGREINVDASAQSETDEKWLRKQSRSLGYHGDVPRAGFAERWMPI